MKNKNICIFAAILMLLFGSCGQSSSPDTPVVPPIPPKPVKYYYPPVMRIVTEGKLAVTSLDNYLNATLVLQKRDSSESIVSDLLTADTEIKGRGHSTWEFPKKPYRLKLKTKAELLGMPASRHWVLLANYTDKTLMRNELAFEVSRLMGFTYTPRSQYVDLYMNDSFVGNYMLTEFIRVDPARVNINELKPEDTDITGGYLLEINNYMDDPVFFKTKISDVPISVKSPENIPQKQLDYIVSYVQKVEDILYGVGGVNPVTELPKYLDMKSFIDYYLLNELSKNVDGNLRLSTFMYKKRGDNKLYFGPVWDYDIAFGNSLDTYQTHLTSGWHARKALWYGEAFFSHPEFEQMVKNRWKELRATKLNDLSGYIDQLALRLEKSQGANFKKWDILNLTVWPNPQVAGSYQGEVNYLKNWLQKRIEWMDSQLK